jgi:hypothetical protein
MLQETGSRIDLNTLEPPGIDFSGKPRVHFSPGVDAFIGRPEAVRVASPLKVVRREPYMTSSRRSFH